MKRCTRLWLGIVLVLSCACAWSQNDAGSTDNAPPAQPGPTPAFTYPDASPTMDFLNEATENSSITLGAATGFSYYSASPQSDNGTGTDSWLFHVAPLIKIQQYRSRFSWKASYSPGYQRYTHSGERGAPANNLFQQRASGQFLWQMSPHWQMMGENDFSHSANPFDAYLTSPGNPSINNPNPVTYYPLTQYTLNNAILSLTDQITKEDTLTFTGTQSLRSTSSSNLLQAPFYNLTSYGGRASYSHQFSPQLSLGAGYDFSSLDFGSGVQRAGISSITMTAVYRFHPNTTISVWAGPEYVSTKDTVPTLTPDGIVYLISRSSQWSAIAGADFGWQSVRNVFHAGFSRQILDGGGLTATSQVIQVNASYRRMLTSKLDALLGIRYFDVASITVSNRKFDNVNFNAGLSYRMTKSLTATADYSYRYQTQSNIDRIGTNTYDVNIVGATISYNWTHPLGR